MLILRRLCSSSFLNRLVSEKGCFLLDNFLTLIIFRFLHDQMMKSFTGSVITDDDFFLITIDCTKFSSPNTSSTNARTRCTFSSPICTKMEPESASRSRATVSRSRR